MQILFQNKLTLSIVLLFLLGLLGYRLLSNPVPLNDNQSALVVGRDLVKIADELSRASLSQDLFEVPGYRYLTDFTTPLVGQTFGRANPFGPLGK